jgi:hypothetical protein
VGSEEMDCGGASSRAVADGRAVTASGIQGRTGSGVDAGGEDEPLRTRTGGLLFAPGAEGAPDGERDDTGPCTARAAVGVSTKAPGSLDLERAGLGGGVERRKPATLGGELDARLLGGGVTLSAGMRLGGGRLSLELVGSKTGKPKVGIELRKRGGELCTGGGLELMRGPLGVNQAGSAPGLGSSVAGGNAEPRILGGPEGFTSAATNGPSSSSVRSLNRS